MHRCTSSLCSVSQQVLELIILEDVEHVEDVCLLLQSGADTQLVHQCLAVHIAMLITGQVHLRIGCVALGKGKPVFLSDTASTPCALWLQSQGHLSTPIAPCQTPSLPQAAPPRTLWLLPKGQHCSGSLGRMELTLPSVSCWWGELSNLTDCWDAWKILLGTYIPTSKRKSQGSCRHFSIPATTAGPQTALHLTLCSTTIPCREVSCGRSRLCPPS